MAARLGIARHTVRDRAAKERHDIVPPARLGHLRQGEGGPGQRKTLLYREISLLQAIEDYIHGKLGAPGLRRGKGWFCTGRRRRGRFLLPGGRTVLPRRWRARR